MPTIPRVLIVEDDAAIRSLLAAALRRETLEIDVAGDGVDALAKLARCEYAVIVADLMMPRMNGYAFIDALRRLPLRVRPVVFVMTAFDDTALRELNPQWVHGCFRKPFDVGHVVQVIRDCAMLLAQHQVPAIDGALDELPPEVV
jgi:CheY-like chemotaxis protein